VHNTRANALLRIGKTQEAIAEYRQALRGEPRYADAHYNIANALASIGLTKEAVEHYEESIRYSVTPADAADAHNNLGVVLVAMGRRDEAIFHYQQAIRLNPDLTSARVNLQAALAGAVPAGK
jgi:tetratricopeptide (TPR) repeat protein